LLDDFESMAKRNKFLVMCLGLARRVWIKFLSLSLYAKIEIKSEFQIFFNEKLIHIKGWISLEESFLLYSAAKSIMPDESVVEIGSYCGRSTIALGKALKEQENDSTQLVYSIDPHTGDISEVQKGIKVDTWNNFISNVSHCDLIEVVNPIKLTSTAAISKVSGVKVGLLFIDGWHSYEAVTSDIRNYLPLVSHKGIVCLDDWRQPDILKAIIEAMPDLPNFLGFLGKVLVFSNCEPFNQSKLGKSLKARLRITSLFNSIYQDSDLRKILEAQRA
jgi:predicted O-methyltransferase YrrM